MDVVTSLEYDPLALLSESEEDDPEEASTHGMKDPRMMPSDEAMESYSEPAAKRPRWAPEFGDLEALGYGGATSEREIAERSLQITFEALTDAYREDENLGKLERSGCPMALLEVAARRQESFDELGCEEAPDNVEVYDESGGSGQLEPWLSFKACEPSFGKLLMHFMRSAGFVQPTPIQAQTWPYLNAGRDLIGVAQTGSGKTLAFLLPCFAKLLQKDEAKSRSMDVQDLPIQMQKCAAGPGAYSPDVLVIAPSRELVMQIAGEAQKFASATGINTLALYGGECQRARQRGRLRERPACVVSTLGRLTNFLASEHLWFSVRTVRFLVLDEADHMLAEGLSAQIRQITTDVDKDERQSMLFSATIEEEVATLATWILRRPVEIRVGKKDPLRANRDIDQQVTIVKDDLDRDGALKTILRTHFNSYRAGDAGKILVFVDDSATCEIIKKKLTDCWLPVKVGTLHAHKNQRDREKMVSEFRQGVIGILIATSLAARGLDIKHVDLVVNFEPPSDGLDYVHRIGRTGRTGLKGKAISLLRKGPDGHAMAYIAQVMRRTGKVVPQVLIEALKQRRGRDREFAAALLEGLCDFDHIDRTWT